MIDRALQDLGEDAVRPGVRSIDDIRQGYFLYHLKWSRQGLAGSTVRQPRHLMAFSIDTVGSIVVAPVVHERQLPARHLADRNRD